MMKGNESEKNLPKVFAKLHIHGDVYTKVNVFAISGVVALKGYRRLRCNAISKRKAKLFSTKYPVMSKVFNPYQPMVIDSIWFPSVVEIQSLTMNRYGELHPLFTVSCRDYEQAKKIRNHILDQLEQFAIDCT